MMDALIEATATAAFLFGFFGLPLVVVDLYERLNPRPLPPDLDACGNPRNVRVRK